jgi:hypothetical protein
LSGSQEGGFRILPQMSNSGSPPAKPGVYPGEIKMAVNHYYLFIKVFVSFDTTINPDERHTESKGYGYQC